MRTTKNARVVTYYCIVIHYLSLQRKMLDRHMVAFGVHPVVGYLLTIIVFIGLSMLIFDRVIYPQYTYSLVGLYMISKSAGTERTNFLKTCYPTHTYRQLRLIEHCVIITPFVIFLFYKLEFIVGIGILVVAIILSLMQIRSIISSTIPTPYGKYPFEFIRGFRYTFLLIGLSYFLLVMAIRVDNFNLGLFALAAQLLIYIGYYGDVESEYLVWIHKMSPATFLRHKLKTGITLSSLSAIPIAITLTYFYPSHNLLIAGVFIIGVSNMASMIVMRYALYPKSPGLPQALLYAITMLCPPLLLFTIPFFYRRSLHNLHITLA